MYCIVVLENVRWFAIVDLEFLRCSVALPFCTFYLFTFFIGRESSFAISFSVKYYTFINIRLLCGPEKFSNKSKTKQNKKKQKNKNKIRSEYYCCLA